MKPEIHPEYSPVIFEDPATGDRILTRSTLAARLTETALWEDGNTYPVLRVDVSAYSHPFWTGKGRTLDTVGRVSRFERRYGKKSS